MLGLQYQMESVSGTVLRQEFLSVMQLMLLKVLVTAKL